MRRARHRSPSEYCARLNHWMQMRGALPYFYSATKSELYDIPSRNPRPSDASLYRLTELCSPASGAGRAKPFNRIGDNGTVGGQTLVGLMAISKLLDRCDEENVPVAVWPFDGLSLEDDAYLGAHVMIEPYPSAVREIGIAQSDAADALASAEAIRRADMSNGLLDLLDLSHLDETQSATVRLEGWIASHRTISIRR